MSESNSEPIIRVEGLTAAFGANVIVSDISFEVERGEIFVILGGSGSGKSTVMKHLIGLHEPVAGKIWIDGEEFTSMAGEERRRVLRKFGVMYQSGALFGSMSLLENVRLPLEEFTDLPEEAMNLVAMMKLDLVGLRDAARQLPAEASGGMQKRAAIARACVLDPLIVFLDEPSAGLDPITSAQIDQLILDLAESLEITFVIVSHELASIFAIADRVILLDRQSRGIVATGTPRELERSDDANVRGFFRREPAP